MCLGSFDEALDHVPLPLRPDPLRPVPGSGGPNHDRDAPCRWETFIQPMCPGKRLCRRFGLGRQIGVHMWPKLNSYLGQAGFRPSPRARGGRFDVRPPLPCRPLRRLGTRLANRPSADRAIDPTSGFRGGISLGSVHLRPGSRGSLARPRAGRAGLDAGNVAFARQGRRPGPLLPCVPIPCSRVPNMACRRAQGLPGPVTGTIMGDPVRRGP